MYHICIFFYKDIHRNCNIQIFIALYQEVNKDSLFIHILNIHTVTAIEKSINEIDAKIKEASRSDNIHKIEGLVIAKYILIGNLTYEEEEER